VLLNWETATETNNASFTVERSTDGKQFKAASEALPGRGTTTTRQQYQWQDAHPVAGLNYYRLRQMDYTGATSYSPVVPVTYAAEGVWLQNNTTEAQHLTVTLAPEATATHLQVLDAVGRVRFSQFVPAHGEQLTTEVKLPSLASGMYFLHAESSGQRKIIRFAR
jgi:transglutaminase/protease-like cytokinesis protein 3